MFSYGPGLACSTGPGPCGTIVPMDDAKQRMQRGEWYWGNAPELLRDRQQCQELLDRFNTLAANDEDGRRTILRELLAGLGENTQVMPRLQCDYGYLTTIGSHSFLNYDTMILDCAPVTIGNHVLLGPRVQLLTPLHPMEDPEARKAGWERAAPITIGDNVWFGGGVIVSAGVTVGENAVVGAGSVITNDVPAGVFAAGNPARVIRQLGPQSA